ncbi:CBS domain-containing protein, partial [Staphylococcus nepalensis]
KAIGSLPISRGTVNGKLKVIERISKTTITKIFVSIFDE